MKTISKILKAINAETFRKYEPQNGDATGVECVLKSDFDTLAYVLIEAVEQRDRLMNDWAPWHGKHMEDAIDYRNGKLLKIARGET